MTEKDEPLNLIVINGLSADQLRAQLEHSPRFRGIPIVPAGCEVQIIPLPPRRIRYSLRIRLMEWAIKRVGLWGRYRDALGFGGPALRMPIRHQVFLGVPFCRRVQALWCVVSRCPRPHGISQAHRDMP